jgi:SAM-dependent methyltransferase
VRFMMDAGHQQRQDGPGGHEGSAVCHGTGEYRPAPTDYDAELRLYNEVLRRACGVQHRYHVQEFGCGSGQTTREAARIAQAGSALGVDISGAAVERARGLARAQGAPVGATRI